MTEGKQLAPMETFLERVKGKLRDDIGSLLPEEAIEQMVQKVVNEEFFTKKRVPDPNDRSGSYNRRMIDQPTAFQEMVLEAARPILAQKALEIVAARAPELEAAITEAMNAGLMRFAMTAFDKVFAEAVSRQSWNIENIVREAMRAERI